MMTGLRCLAVMLCVFVPVAWAQQADVTFFVIGKHANFEQQPDGDLVPVDFSFFSEIFLTASGNADAATLMLPDGEVIEYRDMRDAEAGDRDNLLLVTGEERYMTFDDLQARYPDGDYRVSFVTPGGNADGVLTFQRRPLPAPPVTELRQAGRPCTRLQPGIDVTVSWTPFEDGRADPNGILDDLVFVILEDAAGIRVAHSGRPFEGRPFLTFNDRSFVISGDAFDAGQRYMLSVEHALLDDTMTFDGVPAFTTRAITTKRAFVVGKPGQPCTRR